MLIVRVVEGPQSFALTIDGAVFVESTNRSKLEYLAILAHVGGMKLGSSVDILKDPKILKHFIKVCEELYSDVN